VGDFWITKGQFLPAIVLYSSTLLKMGSPRDRHLGGAKLGVGCGAECRQMFWLVLRNGDLSDILSYPNRCVSSNGKNFPFD